MTETSSGTLTPARFERAHRAHGNQIVFRKTPPRVYGAWTKTCRTRRSAGINPMDCTPAR